MGKLVGSGSGAKDLVIGVCHESPTASNEEFLYEEYLLPTLIRKYLSVAAVIMGDFNHGDLNL